MSNIGLTILKHSLVNCKRCTLCHGRKNIVFGGGNSRTRWMFIGEAPGANEDKQGEPFVGMAGKFLDRMIQKSGWSRKSVYVTNVVKCRPPGNKTPSSDEIEACKSFLLRQIHHVDPVVITTLGKTAANLLLNNKTALCRLRGQKYKLGQSNTIVVPTYHPSYVIRGSNKIAGRLMEEDLAMARDLLARRHSVKS